MTPKSLVLAIYESSLLSNSGLPLVEGWRAISRTHSEPEVASFFSDLGTDFMTGKPSFRPYERSGLKDGTVIACYFAELAANSTLYEKFWSDMAMALVLKKKLQNAEPSAEDVQLGSYLLSFGDTVAGMDLRKEMESWSASPSWQLAKSSEESPDFPASWWETFTVNQNEFDFPPTMNAILKVSLQTGMVDPFIPQTILNWSRFVQVVNQVYT